MNGDIDSCGVYTFKAIDYRVKIDVEWAAGSALSRDTVQYVVIVTNDGALSESYNLSVTRNT